jgi:hypothetical protein
MPVIAQTQNVSQPFFPMADQATSATPASSAPETVTVTAPASDDSGKSFFDNLLDVVNPLEHFPIVSTIYSNLTGDKPNDFTQVAGDTLYGGPLGLVSSIGNLVFKDVTGKSVGDTVWGWVTNKSADAKTASDDVRQNQKPSTDLFSFLRANVGSDYGSTEAVSNTTPVKNSTSNVANAVAAPVAAAVSAAAANTPASTTASASATTPPRLLNSLPAWGAVPSHASPSENMRAAGMAAMVANRAHLHALASEGNAPAMKPAAPVQNTTQPTPVAANKLATVPVGKDGIPTLDDSGEQALMAALNQNGISGAIGQQALMAYQKTMAMNPDPSNAAALQSATTLH